MSHEMMEHDSAAYFKNPAWHGLGRTVEDAMSVDDALELAGLNWEVDKWPLFTANAVRADDYRGVMRTDTKEIIGVVSPRYQMVQNWEAFNLAKHFGADVNVESAGSIQNGRKVYLLLRGETFDATPNDPVSKYMALFWGHDGTASLTVLPTSVRVVCKNTLDMVIGQSKGTSNKISISHAGDISEKITEAEEAVRKFKETGKFFEKQVGDLTRQCPGREGVNTFFKDVYSALTGNHISPNPVTEKEEAVYVDAVQRISKWTETYELESQTLGSWDMWTAANAVSNDIQHRVAARGKKKTAGSAAYSNLIGKNAMDTRKVFNMALATV
tara:strand:- start:564 stop:1547 length:984 start_codon:yes stop_codon:yes gene_type:complete